jgi:hypothetical protein
MTDESQSLAFTNESTRRYLGRRGPPRVFGDDVDEREKFNDREAEARFDERWNGFLAGAVAKGGHIEFDVAVDMLKDFEAAQKRLDRGRSQREVRVRNCIFIAQLDGVRVEELWFVQSSSGDPRGLWVQFESVGERQEYESLARNLKSELGELVLKLLRDLRGTFRDK